MIKAIIFDVDGTLVDSVDYHAEAWQRTFAKYGKEVSFADVRAQIGKGGDQLLPVFFGQEEREKLEKPMTDYRSELFKEEYLGQVKAFPRVRELFQRLLADGKKIALASSAKGDELESYKRIAQIDDLLDAETSSDDADKSKPHPDIFEAALEKLGGPAPEECVVIGDTPYDIEAASKAGIKTVAVRCGGFPDETLRGAVAIYDDPADLLAGLQESPLGGSHSGGAEP